MRADARGYHRACLAPSFAAGLQRFCYSRDNFCQYQADQWVKQAKGHRDMKTRKWVSCSWALVFVASYALTVTNLSGQGSVVFSGRVTLGTNVYPGNYALSVINTPDGSGGTSIFINRSGAEIAFVTSYLDEGSGWYFASANDVFTASTIRAGEFVLFGGHPDLQPGPSFRVGFANPFYLAVASGRWIYSPGDQEPYWVEPVFGRGLFHNTPTGLVLLDSAVAYGSEGIVVGTLIAVPEPTCIAFFISGALGLLVMGRFRRFQGWDAAARKQDSSNGEAHSSARDFSRLDLSESHPQNQR